MGQARNRGPREARVAQAQVAFAALTDPEKRQATLRRLPAPARRQLAFAAALTTLGEILIQLSKSKS